MNVTIVDYNSGNISSVINSFKEVAKDKVNIEVTSDLNKIKFKPMTITNNLYDKILSIVSNNDKLIGESSVIPENKNIIKYHLDGLGHIPFINGSQKIYTIIKRFLEVERKIQK